MFSTFSGWRNLRPKALTIIVQPLSTTAYGAKPERISKNLSFRSANPGEEGSSDRPLALIFGWLMSKSRHIHKYGDFYLGKNFDVLHIKIEPLQMLWPIKTQSVIGQISDFLGDSKHASQPLLVHGFSVGAYLYGELLGHLYKQGEPGLEVGQRLVGQIFDSPVDYMNIPHGFSKAVTQVPVVQKTMEASINLYMKTFQKKVTDHYKASSQNFRENQLGVPSLMLYSSKDPVGDAATIEDVMAGWRARGVEVDGKCWSNSPHVSHFHHHPVEYISQLNMFLEKIRLTVPEAQQAATQTL